MDNAHAAPRLIDRYLNGLAEPDELRQLQNLLEADPAVADRLLAAAEIESLVERHAHDEPYRTELRQTLARLEGRRRPVLWLAAAACLLIAVGGIAWWQFSRSGAEQHTIVSGQVLVDGVSNGRIVEGAAIVVLGESPAVIRLTDGSQAELEPASEAVLHGGEGAARQVVELRQGSGVFHVPSGDRPLRVDTPVGNVTTSAADFSVDFLRSNSEGEDEMRPVSTLAALVVTVAAGIVEVDIQSQVFVLKMGEGRVFAAEEKGAAGNKEAADKKTAGDKKEAGGQKVVGQKSGAGEKKAGALPMPPGDMLGFQTQGKSIMLEKMFPGISAAIMLTDDQKRQIQAARLATVESETVKAAGLSVKSDPQLKAEQKEQALKAVGTARKELQAKIDAILTVEQKELIKRLNAAADESQQAVGETFRGENTVAKGDKAKSDELRDKMREPLLADFKTRAAKFLNKDQLAAMEEAAAAYKTAEERAKNDPKKVKGPKP